jgi:hypothetical protein
MQNDEISEAKEVLKQVEKFLRKFKAVMIISEIAFVLISASMFITFYDALAAHPALILLCLFPAAVGIAFGIFSYLRYKKVKKTIDEKRKELEK